MPAVKRFALILLIVFTVNSLQAQETKDYNRSSLTPDASFYKIPLIGEPAPSFTAESTQGPIDFPGDYAGRWKILFAHPQDFTPVCSSELLELAYLQNEFEKLGVQLVVVSTDNLETHEQWENALQQINYKGRGNVRIRFPLVDDKNLEAAKKYGMLHPSTNSTRYVRGVFIIDPDNIVRAIYFYPMEVGRSTAELLRTVVALKTSDQNAVMTPAEWTPGDDVLVRTLPGSKSSDSGKLPDGFYRIAWFMTFKKIPR
jgi:peroxiredoxin 2/4